MKMKAIIKEDFFTNPENYGYFANDDLLAIWREIIKPIVKEMRIDTAKYINSDIIHEWVIVYRKTFRELNG
jgi:hypothetical protein